MIVVPKLLARMLDIRPKIRTITWTTFNKNKVFNSFKSAWPLTAVSNRYFLTYKIIITNQLGLSPLMPRTPLRVDNVNAGILHIS